MCHLQQLEGGQQVTCSGVPPVDLVVLQLGGEPGGAIVFVTHLSDGLGERTTYELRLALDAMATKTEDKRLGETNDWKIRSWKRRTLPPTRGQCYSTNCFCPTHWVCSTTTNYKRQCYYVTNRGSCRGVTEGLCSTISDRDD